jgi:CDP-diacylglycerol pyrophosphatase
VALLAVLALAPRLLAAADPDALWNIVHGRCVPNAERGAGPAACSLVDLAVGYAVLKDIRGRPSSC